MNAEPENAPPPTPEKAPEKVRVDVPTGLSPVSVGPLELTPQKATEKLVRRGNDTCIESFVRFRVRNTSAGDLRVSLFMSTVIMTDDTGDSLFKNIADVQYVQAAGVATAHQINSSPTEWLDKNKTQLTTLAPGQSVTVQLRVAETGWGAACHDDQDLGYKKTHRPRSYTISGSLGIVDLTDNATVRSFSMEDVPLDVLS